MEDRTHIPEMGESATGETPDENQYDVSSYDFNHPKSYIGYAIAFGLGGTREEADRLVEEYVVGGADMARRGAQNMGLVSHERDGNEHFYSLTDRGEWLCSNAPECFEADDLEGVLEAFDEMRGARERFVDTFPKFAEIAPDVIRGDPTVDRLITLLEDVHHDRVFSDHDYSIGTTGLFWSLWNLDAAFAGSLLIRDHDGLREIVLGDRFEDLEPGEGADELIVQMESIEHGAMPHDATPVYRSAATFQLKNLLWHMGVLQSKGAQSKELAKEGGTDTHDLTWALETQMLDREPRFSTASEVEIHG